MSVSPLGSASFAVGAAGSDRASSATNSANRVSHGGSHNSGAGSISSAERVAQADLSGDGSADGRQLLDSFESSDGNPSSEDSQSAAEPGAGAGRRNAADVGDQPATCPATRQSAEPINIAVRQPGQHLDLFG